MNRFVFYITAMTVVLSACTTTKETASLYDDIYYTGKSVKTERNDSMKTASHKDAFMKDNQAGKYKDFMEEHQGDEALAFMEESQGSKEDIFIVRRQDNADDASLKKGQASQPDTLIEEIQASRQDSLMHQPHDEDPMGEDYNADPEQELDRGFRSRFDGFMVSGHRPVVPYYPVMRYRTWADYHFNYTSRIIRFHRDFRDFYYFHPILLSTGFYMNNYSFIIDFLVYSPDYSPTYAEDIEKAAEAYEGFGLQRVYKPCGTPDEMFKPFR